MSLRSALAYGRALALALAVSSVSVCLGCVAQTSASAESYGYGGSSSSGGSGSSSGGNKPMLVVVDTDQVMNASPGQGIGVFTEYRSGGHWHVWWTCDTNKTALPCSFDITASVANGAITNLAATSPQAGEQVSQSGPQQIDALTTTTTSVDGVTFDAPAGETITLDAQVSPVPPPPFLFFVQKGKINGGYAGPLTDPLMLQPSSP